jgi:pimeloyl-ACP methyl ester carboxylesterase
MWLIMRSPMPRPNTSAPDWSCIALSLRTRNFEKFNEAQRDKVDLPFVLVGGENSFASLLPKLAEDLRAHGRESVSIEIIKNSGHYVVDEQPEVVAALIERYASQ